MIHRRILSLWFPRLGAERLLRLGRRPPDDALAVIAVSGQGQTVASVTAAAEARGLRRGMALADARAILPDLVTYPAHPRAEAAFLEALRRWAERFSPWVGTDGADGLLLDVTGCAHLFDGEAGLARTVTEGCAELGLTLQLGLADTVGAAWALAHYAGQGAVPPHNGDAIEQEARATRARAGRRRGAGLAPRAAAGGAASASHAIAPPGQMRSALDPLPVAALRLDADTCAALARLGLRRVGDLAGQPRAGLARRFGTDLARRLDQAFGLVAEPVAPPRHGPRFVLRLTLPDPIGLETDLRAGLDRLLPPLARRLSDAGQGARVVRLEALRCDHWTVAVDVTLAAATADPARIRPLLDMKLPDIDAGPGIDALRLAVLQTEPQRARDAAGHLDAAARAGQMGAQVALEDLVARLGARLGGTAASRLHPAGSHIPEKTATVHAAGWSAPAGDWPPAPTPRPLLMWRPEPVTPVAAGPDPGPDGDAPCDITGTTAEPDAPPPYTPPPGLRTPPPGRFRWRRGHHACAAATGPERIAPEWWLDDPDWRSGTRDYWQITTTGGARLWLFYAHGRTMPGGWFCQGAFA
jgi:protein ImuB